MLSGESNAGDRRKTTIGLNSKKKKQQQLSTCSTLFFFFFSFPCRCLARLQRKTSRNRFFMGGNVVSVIVHFFSLPLIFTLHRWPLAFLILSSLLQNFHIGFQQKMSPFFYLSLQISVALFLVEFCWPVAYSLFFSVFLLLYVPNLWTGPLI